MLVFHLLFTASCETHIFFTALFSHNFFEMLRRNTEFLGLGGLIELRKTNIIGIIAMRFFFLNMMLCGNVGNSPISKTQFTLGNPVYLCFFMITK